MVNNANMGIYSSRRGIMGVGLAVVCFKALDKVESLGRVLWIYVCMHVCTVHTQYEEFVFLHL
jgi:hypothetical protein